MGSQLCRSVALVATVSFTGAFLPSSPVTAEPARCTTQARLSDLDVNCSTSSHENRTRAGSPESGPRPPRYPYNETRSLPACFSGSTPPAEDRCSENAACSSTADGRPTFLHLTSVRTVNSPSEATEWVTIGYECLSLPQTPEAITAVEVEREFRRLSWPKAELHIQPTGGTTLVNKNTYAHTTSPGPVTKDVTLLGQRVIIEATPTSWTWHWGDGTNDTTDHPGAPHPGAVNHAYRRATPVNPRVDVTYRGRYRINGGDWQPLADTHTVAGDPQSLEVREAISQLVQ